MPGALHRTRCRRRRDDAGASAVEFALVAIPLLILLMGILQASAWMWAKQAGAHASREGARRAAVAPACTGFDTYVKDFVGPAAQSWTTDPSYGVTRVVTPAPGNTSGITKVGDMVTVTVKYEPVGFVSLLPDFPDIAESVESRIENVPSSAGAC